MRKQGEVEDLGAGTRVAVKNVTNKLDLYIQCRQVWAVKVDNPEVAVVAEWDSVKDKQKFEMKDFSLLVPLEAPQRETRGCTAQCELLDMLEMVGLAMATHLFLEQ